MTLCYASVIKLGIKTNIRLRPRRSDNPKVLEVIDLTLCRGARPVLAGLHFAVASSRCLQVLGANGSGKTTLLRALCGLLEIEGGSLRWKGSPVEPRSPEFQRELVYLGHDPPLKGDLSVAENLRFAAVMRGVSRVRRNEAVAAALLAADAARFADRLARSLSAGQQRRVALALLCLAPAPIWLLDEPVTHLDATGLALVTRIIEGHLQRGGLVIAATHQDLGLPSQARDELVLSRRAA